MVIQRTYHEVASRLASCLNSLAGGNKPQQIQPDLSALRQWGLDSEDGIDVAADMGSQLGIEIPHYENPLVAESRTGQKRARTFKEVVQYLLKFTEGREE